MPRLGTGKIHVTEILKKAITHPGACGATTDTGYRLRGLVPRLGDAIDLVARTRRYTGFQKKKLRAPAGEEL